jgi:large subunit ribosomal protein L2
MATKQYHPTSPGRRGMSVADYSQLDAVQPLSSLTVSLKKHSGRNNQGRITCRHKGGAQRRKYRLIDWKRDKRDVVGVVETLEYDPNRTAFIALVLYKDGERRYILAPDKLEKGMEVVAADKADVKVGNSMPLKSIPFGVDIHNVELRPGGGAKMVRSAGGRCQLVGRVDGWAQLKMPSGEMRRVQEDCMATIGVVSNLDHSNVSIGKAGRARWMGIRPTIRGVAMNPIDHPHGGGEGKTSGGRHPVSPWAQPTKGYKTRKNKRTDKDIIRRAAKRRESRVK